jgi:hypothetical protein
MATFEDHVNVLRLRPSNTSDLLTCELLSILFTKKAGSPATVNSKAAFDLEPLRIEATGAPASISAPANKMYARGEHLQYDCQTGCIALGGNQEVVLQQDADEIHARSIQYQPAPPGRPVGRLLAQGPGWLRGKASMRPGTAAGPVPPPQLLEARWNNQLLVRPQQHDQVISLTGGAALILPDMGQIEAAELHFWLLEHPERTGTEQLQPDRLLAKSNVRVGSSQLSCAVEQLEVWFEPATVAAAPVAGSATPAAAMPAGAAPTAAAPVAASPLPGLGAPNGSSRQHIDVAGRLLQLKVLLRQPQMEVSGLTVVDGVQFRETQTAEPGQRPLLVTGERLHAADINLPSTTVVVEGQPAHFEGRGLALTGTNIHFDRGQNRLWIDGAGRMDVPLDRDLQGRPLRSAGTLQVDWRERMNFDGRTAHFERDVVAVGPAQTLRTKVLEATFAQPVQFGQLKMQEQPQVESIHCDGGVQMENRTLDPQTQQMTSHERMQVNRLDVNLLTGATGAEGPGWLVSVRRGGADAGFGNAFAQGGMRPAQPVAVPAALPAGPKKDGLNCLHVRFQGPIVGNLLRHEITFRDRVRAAYAPVATWDAELNSEDPQELGPGSVVLHCEQMSIVDMTAAGTGQRALEFGAAGNAVVEGGQFTARAARISYAEIKDLLVLEGDGRTDAELFRQAQPGSEWSKETARKILFWPKTRRASVDGQHALEYNMAPGQRNGGTNPAWPTAPRGR